MMSAGVRRAVVAPLQVVHVLKAAELSHETYMTGISSVKKPVPYHFAGCTLKHLGLSVSCIVIQK